MKYVSLVATSALFLFLSAGAMEHIAPRDKELFEAIQKGDVGGVETALHNGAGPNTLNYDGHTPLIATILARHIDASQRRSIIRFLMYNGADTNTPDQQGETPLRTAINFNDKETVSQLIAGRGKKANVNERDKNGETPLMLAARVGNYDIARALIQQHADKNAVDDEGNTALSIAQAYGHEDIVKFLTGQRAQPKGERFTESKEKTQEIFNNIFNILKTNDRQQIEQLIADEGNLNIVDSLGRTLLGLAAADERIKNETLLALIKGGANVNFVSPETGRTPLMDYLAHVTESALLLRPTRIMFFVENGADVNHRDKEGNTPLMLALRGNTLQHFRAVEELLEAGADVNASNLLGRTPLSMVTEAGNTDLAQLLIGYGATYNEHHIKLLRHSLMHEVITNDPSLLTELKETNTVNILSILLFAIGIRNNTAASSILNLLASYNMHKFMINVVEQALKRAIIVGNFAIVKEIFETFTSFIDTAKLTQAIETATLTGKINILRYLLGQDPNHAVDLSYAITLAQSQARGTQQTTYQAIGDLLMAHSAVPPQQAPHIPLPPTSEPSFWNHLFGGFSS